MVFVGYVIMPSHFYWIVKTEPEQGTISDIMRDIKEYIAWDILNLLREERPLQVKEFRKDVKKGQKHQLRMHRFDDQVTRNNKMF